MPLNSNAPETHSRLNNVLICLSGAVETVEIIANSLQTPFLEAIANTSRSLLTTVQTIKKNKNDCTRLLEQTYTLIYAIISLHIKSETGGDLSPGQLNHLAKFTETLHKIYTFVEAQQEKSRIKQFFRQAEMNTLLKDCNTGLQQAMEVFRVQNIDPFQEVSDAQKAVHEQYQEVLQLIEGLSDFSSSDRKSLINQILSSSNTSSSSISMLPSEPKIFHGRELELSEILAFFMHEVPRIAILGPGGMGKTSLARAVLHRPEITAKYDKNRFFIACDTASTAVDLASRIAEHMGLKPGKDLRKSVVRYFTSNVTPSLLILDNMETLWESADTREDIEELLSLLTDVPHLALIITMRGAERPVKVRWTRPFLPPLTPLSQDAAQQTFLDIADDSHDIAEINQVLLLTDNMPLAIDLLAHLADSEGCFSVLSQWENEGTSLIYGTDRRSSLDMSISLSLESIRLQSIPQSRALLALLSMLPDGLSNTELLQSELPIDNILDCKAALLRTSLAYNDDQKRLKVLVPIREFMQKFYPPEASLVAPLLGYFQSFWSSTKNITEPSQNILLNGLQSDKPPLATLYCIVYLSGFSALLGRGFLPLMNRVVPPPEECEFKCFYVTEILRSWTYHQIPNVQVVIDETEEDLSHFSDTDVKVAFYNALGVYYLHHRSDLAAAMRVHETSLSLAMSTGNTKAQSHALWHMAWTKCSTGDYSAGLTLAYDAEKYANISADVWKEAQALRIEAMCWEALGNYKHALSVCKRATDMLALCGMSGGTTGLAVMNTQAEIHKLKSEYVEARKIQIQLLSKVNVEQELYIHAFTLLNIAELDVHIGTCKEDVQKHIDAANSIFHTLNLRFGVMMCDSIQADLNLREGNSLSAQRLLRNCLDLSRGVHAEVHMHCLEILGDGSFWDTEWTPSWTIIFLAYSVKSNQKRGIYQALQFLAEVFQAEGDQDMVVTLLTVALEGFTNMDIHRNRAQCMLQLGDISKDRGNAQKALAFWKTARVLFDQSSQKDQVTLVDEKLDGTSQDLSEEQARSLTHLAKIYAPTGELDIEIINRVSDENGQGNNVNNEMQPISDLS